MLMIIWTKLVLLDSLQVDACIWFVLELAARLNGAGCAKPNGQEIVWEPTGLDENASISII